MNGVNAVDMTLKEQVRVLKKVVDEIPQSCTNAILSIACNRSDIIKGVNKDDGRAVVDSLEPHLSMFYELACEKDVLSGALEALSPSHKSLKCLPSVTALCACLEVLLDLANEKDALHKVVNTDYGSVVNDYLQGDPLTMIENVANACANFKVIRDHIDEMVMLAE